MDPLIVEWVNLGLRWAHVITGIAWIGSSFYFMWLDAHLVRTDPPHPTVEGHIWLVHSGGFYVTEKRRLAAGQVPPDLHWFKWEAFYTLITGLLLLCVVYYAAAGTFMVDPGKADLAPWQAIAIGIGTLVVGWLVYDGLWMSPLARYAGWLTAFCCLLLTGVAWALGQVFSGRAAYMHTGALMGVIMAVNVWVRILPAQSAMIAATQAGTPVDWSLGEKAKHRSVHNNYMTLPVVFVMLSSHYPSTYGHPQGWLILIGLFAVGATVRHWFNLRARGNDNPLLIPVAIVGGALLATYAGLGGRDVGSGGPAVAFAEVRRVIDTRCVACHSATPTNPAFETAPKNVKFDSPAEIKAQALPIKAQAVVSRVMPLGNLTEMTDEERDLIGRWVNQGAKVE